jgi:hypothetical protein
MRRHAYTIYLCAGILGLWAGLSCATNSKTEATPDTSSSNQAEQTEEIMPAASYFSSPKQAVPVISELLRKEDFKTLANYYDLSASDIQRSALESGDFFIRKKRPEVGHPGGSWKYKHPFALGFKYASESPSSRKDLEAVHVIEVSISIDQGADSPVQMGKSFFYMKSSDKGWQLLPDQVDEPPAQLPVVVE